MRFWSTDVAADVRELDGRGVEFDTVEFGELKMVDHVLTSPRHREVGAVQGHLDGQHPGAVPTGMSPGGP